MFTVKPFRINKIKAREILDSKGTPTVEVDLATESGLFRSSVPSGISTGKSEAIELRDGGLRFGGKGVLNAVKNINDMIAPKLEGLMISSQEEIDHILIKLDGTGNKSKLGANAILAVSIAASRAHAAQSGFELYRYFCEILSQTPGLPKPCFLLIEGGLHAGNDLDVQEFMIWPRLNSYAEELTAGAEIYSNLRAILEKKYGKNSINVGYEGGFAPSLAKTEVALNLIVEAINNSGYKDKVSIALDIASSTFFQNGIYRFEERRLKSSSLFDFYKKLIENYPIFAIEDPFSQDDFDGFKMITEKLGSSKNLKIIGDDLLTTNLEKIRKAHSLSLCNSVVIKPNQVGTITETIQAVKEAKKDGWGVFMKHRSGETNDDFIADFSVGLGGQGWIMAGAPARGERVAKYNRLLKIEEDLNSTPGKK